jgi:hypothetical protein
VGRFGSGILLHAVRMPWLLNERDRLCVTDPPRAVNEVTCRASFNADYNQNASGALVHVEQRRLAFVLTHVVLQRFGQRLSVEIRLIKKQWSGRPNQIREADDALRDAGSGHRVEVN